MPTVFYSLNQFLLQTSFWLKKKKFIYMQNIKDKIALYQINAFKRCNNCFVVF